jgi:3-dehydro-L-gulonate 2-dehydrogenase
MERAIALSHEHGIGCVSLRNTNHWMRGGSYGWQAAEAGSIGICWTNTLPNLPPWGGSEPCVGNNPLVLAVPRKKGHIVLDIAMSQFSYGALAAYRSRGEQLPVEGGFDTEGNLTRDPAAIESSQRPLPIGYWKGSGLSMVLDTIAAMTSLGKATHQLSTDTLKETCISQIFIAIHPAALGSEEMLSNIADDVVSSLHTSTATEKDKPIRYPGEQVLRIRAENLKLGVPVEEEVWKQILSM